MVKIEENMLNLFLKIKDCPKILKGHVQKQKSKIEDSIAIEH